MHLGTVWNNCVLINYQGQFGGYPSHLEGKIAPEWEKYQQVYPRWNNYNSWYDLEAGICFSGAQLRNGPVGKDHHFIDDPDLFIDGTWGRGFVNDMIEDNEVFTSQEIMYDEECIYSRSAVFDRLKGKSVLVIGAGPSTSAVRWQNLNYDYIWTCNKFYLNSQIRECNVDLVALARDVGLSGNHPFEAYLQRHRTRVVFQLERGSGIDAWKEAHAFVEDYPERCFFFHTRYHSAIGIGARLLCFAILVGLKDIYCVGLDGMTQRGPLHAFEPNKANPQWYKQYGDVLQKRQFVILWDYLLSLKKSYDCNFYNLGEGNPHNVSSNITEQECPLTEQLKRTIALENTDEIVHRSTVATLENPRTGAADRVHTLIDALQDKDETVRRSAAHVLGTICTDAKDAVPTLIVALQDEDEEVRWITADTLGRMGADATEAVPALIAAFRDDDKTVLWVAANTLGKIGKAAVPALIVALKDNEETVRRFAARALGRIGPDAKDAVPALVDTLEDPEATVRRCTARALGRIGPDAKDAVPALVDRLQDVEATVRRRATEALGKVDPDPERVVSALIQTLKDSDERLRWNAAEALGNIGPGAVAAVPALMNALHDEAERIRHAIAKVLGNIGPGAVAAVPALMNALHDNDKMVRAAAADTLGNIGPDAVAAVPALIDILKHERKKMVQRLAARALRKIGPAANEAVLACIGALHSDDLKGTQETTEGRATYSPCGQQMSALIDSLRDQDEGVRWSAAYALRRIGPTAREVVPALIDALQNKDRVVQHFVIDTLHNLGTEAVPALLEALKDKKTMEPAAVVLGCIGPAAKAAVPALIDVLQKEDEKGQWAAAAALGGIGPTAKEAVPALTDALNSKDEMVRQAAAVALQRI